MNRCHILVVLAASVCVPSYAIDPIPRQVPPIGIEIPEPVVLRTSQRLGQLRREFTLVENHPAAADADILLKAAEFALRHREIYQPGDLDLLDATLALAEERINDLKSGKTPWQHDRLTVRGFYSRLDDSPQPYGLVIPQDLPNNQRVPLYVWLHGRGDRTTDIHFIKQRLDKVGQISPPGAIVLHPFGRQCLGFKSAGETDVLEAIEHVTSNYPVDPLRIVLMGFSMGGAGTWHIAAHYTDRFIAVSPGAGFAETAEYNQLNAAEISRIPIYERQLWSLYDVPNYVKNLFNVPIVAYSGEQDKQIQAARVMEKAFAQHGRTLPHVIGPGMGHKYHPDSLEQILATMHRAVVSERPASPRVVHLQTRTLRYPKVHWLQVDRLYEHWQDTTVTAEVFDSWMRISTQASGEPPANRTSNVAQLTIEPLPANVRHIVLDGQVIGESALGEASTRIVFSRLDSPSHDLPQEATSSNQAWRVGPCETDHMLEKQPGLQGPIDDAFLDRFVVVTPSKGSGNPRLDQWVDFELDHLRSRWSALFRGTLPEKLDAEITDADIRESNLVVFGSPTSNGILNRVIHDLPIAWRGERVVLGDNNLEGAQFVPVMIYPNLLNRAKYIVINSGPTFRESHDRTNSLQNPKLPDWALLDISTPPNGDSAGRVVQAGFFDEYWQFKGTQSEKH